MEYSIRPSDDHAYIILTVTGQFTARKFMKCIIEAHTLGQEMGIHSYLVDATNARNVDSAFGNYEFAYNDMKKTASIDPMARVAGLIDPEDHSHDFVETTATNAGLLLKLFTDLTEATNYLKKKDPSGKTQEPG